jgi:hypothetical protein
MKQKFDNRGRCCGLTDPEKEHPLDDFDFHFRSVLFGHQSFGQIDFLLMKSEFQAFGNSPSFWRLYISGFQNAKNLCGAHGKNFAKNIIPFLTPVHSDLLSLGKDEPADKPMKKGTGKALVGVAGTTTTTTPLLPTATTTTRTTGTTTSDSVWPAAPEGFLDGELFPEPAAVPLR